MESRAEEAMFMSPALARASHQMSSTLDIMLLDEALNNRISPTPSTVVRLIGV